MALMFDEMANLWMRRASLGWLAVKKDARSFSERAGMSVMHRYAALCKSLR